MGVSTDAHICFGILLDEDFEFPWDADELDEEDWWLEKVCGWSDAPYYEAKERGDEAAQNAYFAAKREFKEQHPVPIKLVNVCHSDNPIWIIAVPSTDLRASRGNPEEFDPTALGYTYDDIEAFKACLAEHFPSLDANDAKWYLGSYWG